MINRNFTIGNKYSKLLSWKFMLSTLLFVAFFQNANAQCPDGETEISILMQGEAFPGENGWLLWDATAGVSVACVDNWSNGTTVTACVVNDNTIELYAYETFGDAWNGGELIVTTSEDASAYQGSGCVMNDGVLIFQGTQPIPQASGQVNCGAPALSQFMLSSFSTTCVSCALTCPTDIVVNADPDVCGAMVTIPLPIADGTCSPTVTDMSGFYPVGTTEVTFTANAAGVGGEVTCTVNVTVIDNAMPTVTGPADQTISLGGGECSSIFNYLINADDECGNSNISMTQNVDPSFIDFGFACPGGSSSFYRVFNLPAQGINTDIILSDIQVGIAQSMNLATVTVKIYELDGPLLLENLTLITESTLTLPNTFNQLVSFPIVGTLTADEDYVVEIVTPGSIFNGFVMGVNELGQTAPSYLSSQFCNEEEITSLASIGFPTYHLVMSVNGEQQPINIEQTAGLQPGSEFPIGTTTNDFLITDSGGNTSQYSFDLTVEEFGDPINTLACNNLVNVSLDINCEGIITPDMVLEGGPYSCYDNYTVIIKDADGVEYGNMITGDMVGLELIVEIHDVDGNICWGDINIEDKLGPQLECSSRTTQCTEGTEPGDPLANVMRLTSENTAVIPEAGVSSTDLEFEVEGLDGAVITDLNIEVDISHTWVSDLTLVLISPEGSEATLTFGPGANVGCAGNNLDLDFDDEADLTSLDLLNSCSGNNPAIEGSFQSQDALSVFDGEDPNGTWILRVNDLFDGDGGSINAYTLEITQSGGAIGLPIPDGATYTELGNNSYYVFGLDPCGPATLTYTEEKFNMDCTSPYTEVIYRTYTATDASGNSAISCVDTLNVLRTDLGSLVLPRNYDDLDLSAISCTAGYPTPTVTGSPTGAFCENVQMDYEDITIDICEGSYKILRYWTIFEWCSSTVVEHTQIIKVVDNEGPSISCAGFNAPISTSPSTCDASFLIPVPTVSDNCTAFPTYEVEASSGTLQNQGSNYSLNYIEIGVHTITYTAYDNCGNSSSCSFDFEVVDDISPVAICDKHTKVSLSFDDQVYVEASTFDDGSYDECSDITWAARRTSDACGVAGNTSYSSSVVFCCNDVGTTVMVEFRVEDESGNYNTCLVEVEVDDKIAPAIQVPPNVTLNCQDDYKDLSLTGGSAIGFDNCEVMDATYIDFPSIGSCGSGQVTRQWTVMDKSGLSAQESQIIFLQDNDPFDINDISFPFDAVITSCDASTDPAATGEPELQDDICSQVSFTYWDDKFVIVDGACEIIYRKWTVIDACQYTTTNGLGIWEDVQVIEITNTTEPEFTSDCSNQTIDGFGNCEGEVTLAVTATDDCTPEDKLTYTWKIDLFNNNTNGVYDLNNTGSSLTSTFEFGTHRIVWTVADRCGNIETCEYLFTVRDGKAPTPYCIASLSTAVMNTNGEVTIWASDFDLGATDNCTPQNLLVPSFTQNGITNSMTFTCDDITNGVAQLIEDIEIWVTDEAGNQDHCTVSILVEDNEANFCEDLGSITASGSLKTENNQVISLVDLKAVNEIDDELYSSVGADGSYSFDLIPNFTYGITAEKNTDILNGITTLDIVLIQKHILSVEIFDSPFKTIAADTDNNGNITGSDIIAIRKLILGYTDIFPNDQLSWRFVDNDMTFIDVYNVFPYDEVVNIDFTTGSSLNNDFTGVKIGDINGTVNPEEFTGNVDNRTDETLELIIDNQTISAGESFEIPVYASNFEEMIAYQMTMEYDLSAVKILDIKAGALQLTAGNFNMSFLEQGIVTTAWDVLEPVSTEEALFYITVEALQDTDLEQVFKTSSRITETVAYNRTEEEMDIEFSIREGGEILPGTKAFHLYQNTPNPFTANTSISFDLPNAMEVEIEIYDMNGKQMKNIKNAYGAGYQSVMISKEMLGASGVYYYTVRTVNNVSSGKMILIE